MNLTRSPRHDPDDSSRSGLFGSVILYRLLIAVSIILVLLTLGILAIRKYVTTQLPPYTLADIHKLETTTLSLPRDWHQPADLPPANVLAFHAAFQARMEALRAKHTEFLLGDRSSMSGSADPGFLENYRTSGTLTEAQRTSFTAVLADLQPIIDQTSAGVRLEGYSMETDFLLAPISFMDVQTFAKLMCVVAEEQARQGECDQAVESALLPLRLASRPEQSYIMTHLMGTALTNMAAETVFAVCEKCGDPETQQHAVETLNDLYDDVFPGDIPDWFHEDMVAMRFAAAYGYPVDLAPQNHGNIVRQRAELWRLPYYEHLASTLPLSDPRAVAARTNVASLKAQMAAANPMARWTNPSVMSPGKLRLYTMVIGVDPVLLQHTMMAPNLDEATTRAYVAKASIDIARLAAATNLAATEGTIATAGETVSAAGTISTESLTTAPDTETITAYLTPPPVDPFTSGSYPYSSAINRHYSHGPDLDDDKAAIKYDATNGTTSNGDLWLTGRW